MKKILNFYFPCIEDGGLEKNVFSLVNSLAEKKYKINFFTYLDHTKNKKLRNKFVFNKKINVVTSNFLIKVNSRYLRYFFLFFSIIFFLFDKQRNYCFFSRKHITNNRCKNYWKKNYY